jgi:hypothetical protein
MQQSPKMEDSVAFITVVLQAVNLVSKSEARGRWEGSFESIFRISYKRLYRLGEIGFATCSSQVLR